jgi:hypothetical protein
MFAAASITGAGLSPVSVVDIGGKSLQCPHMKPIYLIFFGCVLALSGCAPGGGGQMGDMGGGDDGSVGGISEVPNPDAKMAKAVGKPLSQLQRGHVVYMLNCGQCHQYQLPEKVDIMDWEDAMPKMIGHAGLPTSDETAVLDYVKAVKKVKGQEF